MKDTTDLISLHPEIVAICATYFVVLKELCLKQV